MDEWRTKNPASISLSLRKRRRPKSTTQGSASQSSESSQRSLTSLPLTPSEPVVSQSSTPPEAPTTPTIQHSTSALTAESNHLQDYSCPICSEDLSGLRSSYLRQSHVDKCLTSSAAAESTTPTSSQEEFIYCIFCGKNISHLKGAQKDLHLGRCLDELGEMENNTFAGQPVPIIDDLTTCPVCHESAHCNQRTTTKRKLQHIKSCMRSKNMSMNTLLQKLRWVQWGHKPIERLPAPQPLSSSTSMAAYNPTRPTTLHVTEVVEDDDDFSSNVMFHRLPKMDDRHQRRQLAAEDALDEDLQLALALSRSQAEMELTTRQQQPLNILDPNVSRQVAKTELNNIQLDSHIPNASIKYNIKPLSPSKIQSSSDTTSTPFWDLATTSTHKQDCTYLSKFLINLYHPS